MTPRHLQAVIFDFDGVIANSEPLHLQSFQAVLADEDMSLTPDEYYTRYLGYDDVGMFRRLAADRGLGWGERQVAALVARKGVKMQELLAEGTVLFPGAADFIRHVAALVPVAIASGALKHEILEILDAASIAHLFSTIVAAGDTAESKPSAAPYQLAFLKLREHSGLELDRRRTVAIEDSRWGLASAKGAGLRCVGVTSSYPAEELLGAELVVSGLRDLRLETLDHLCSQGRGS